MGRPLSGSSFADFATAAATSTDHVPSANVSGALNCLPDDLQWPFGRIDSLSQYELREAAYELFFASCRSSPGFGGRHPLTYYSTTEEGGGGGGGGGKGSGVGGVVGGGGGANMAVTSRVKRGLGLRTRKATPPMRVMREMRETIPGGASPGKVKQRPMTSAEIMRQQMGVSEQSDSRLRKALMRSLVGQPGRKAENIVLPLELLRQVKPSEFNDLHEYHQWQLRQLKVLEAGLSLHPSTPLDRLNSAALHLCELVQACQLKPIDTVKNIEAMRTLCNAVAALAWRGGPNNASANNNEVCHWADGYPFNTHLYLALLHSIFDLRDETVVLDEVDELVELMKKTWTILGINRLIHNVCLTWVLFEQYVVTGQIEPDLMGATLAMLTEVASDAKRADREPGFVKILSATLTSMQNWAEKKLMDYHEGFQRPGALGTMENVLCLALTIAKIISEDLPSLAAAMMMDRDDSVGVRVDQYIRSSLKNAFTRVFENGNGLVDSMVVEVEEDPNEVLLQLAKETEALAVFEKNFTPILKRWHPVPAAVAVVTLHNCFGVVLKQYLARISSLSNESIKVLQTAGKLEKVLVQMVVEDSADCEDGGKGIIREMIPLEIDTVIMSLMKNWINERLRIGRECYNRAKETETWNPKSKSEPYAQSAVDLMKLAKATADEFFAIPVAAREDLVQELADGWEALFLDYTAFVASCGTKQSYIPTLPPLTRCNQDPKFFKLWKKAATCHAGIDCPKPTSLSTSTVGSGEAQPSPRPSASRGTQRLYVRLNTLHYLLALVHSIDKSLSFFSRGSNGSGGSGGAGPSPPSNNNRRRFAPTNFEAARSSIQSTILHVAEVAAYRLVFIDCHHTLYEGMYVGGVAEARIRPTLDVLKKNLTLLVEVLTDRAQPLAVREVMKASFYAFLMVLLAGGSGRAFVRSEHEMIAEDFESLKRVFCTCGEGLVAEDVVETEAEVVEAIIDLMGQPTDRLIEDFTTAACEASGLGELGSVHKVPMPSTTGKWNRSDPNTVLRVLCHRDDEAASWFLKKTFQLPRRR